MEGVLPLTREMLTNHQGFLHVLARTRGIPDYEEVGDYRVIDSPYPYPHFPHPWSCLVCQYNPMRSNECQQVGPSKLCQVCFESYNFVRCASNRLPKCIICEEKQVFTCGTKRKSWYMLVCRKKECVAQFWIKQHEKRLLIIWYMKQLGFYKDVGRMIALLAIPWRASELPKRNL
jgi:hypothetical protein